MKISRQVGTTNQILQVFVQDQTVSTGAGLANVSGSNVNYSWFRNNQSAASTGVASTAGALGIYSTSAWVQVSSTNALGWYQFGAPDGVFVSGDSVGIHFYGATNMAPLPVEIELTKTNNQQYASSTVYSSTQIVASVSGTTNVNVLQVYSSAVVTSASGQFLVSTQAIDKGGYGVTSVAGTTNVNVIQIRGSAAVTSAAGQYQVSTQTIDKGGYGVTSVAGTTAVNVIQAYGSAIVTSAAGQFLVSTQAIDKGGYGVTSVAGTTNVNVLQIYGSAAVTSASGQFLVSTQTLTVPDNTGIAAISSQVINPMTESYRANGAAGSMAQLMYEMVGHMGESTITGTEKAIRKIDHSATAATFTLNNSTAPTSITRAT